MAESLDECPRNCTTFQQYGDCDHRHPSEVVELKRERDALQRRVEGLENTLSLALFWLLRAYESGHRQGWEAGPSTQETLDGLFNFLCNENLDPNKKNTPMFVPEIKAALRGGGTG